MVASLHQLLRAIDRVALHIAHKSRRLWREDLSTGNEGSSMTFRQLNRMVGCISNFALRAKKDRGTENSTAATK